MKSRVQLAVLIPIYNVQNYLQECIDSVLRQNSVDVHIFLVDDKSTDQSLAIAQTYAKQYPDQITLIAKEKNGGLAAARNTGLDEIEKSGQHFDYLYFLDSDDALYPGALEKIFSQNIPSSAQLICCQYVEWRVADEFHLREVEPVGILDRQQFGKIYLSSPDKVHNFLGNKLFKFDFVRNFRFDGEIRYAEDWEYMVRCIIPNMQQALIVRQILLRYRLRKSSLTNTCRRGAALPIFKKADLFKKLLTKQEYLYFQECYFNALKFALYAGYGSGDEFARYQAQLEQLMKALPLGVRFKKNIRIFTLPRWVWSKYVYYRHHKLLKGEKNRARKQSNYFA